MSKQQSQFLSIVSESMPQAELKLPWWPLAPCIERDKLKDEPKIKLLKEQLKGGGKEVDERDKADWTKRLCMLKAPRAKLYMAPEFWRRTYRWKASEPWRWQWQGWQEEGMGWWTRSTALQEGARLQPQEVCRKQECHEKEKAFKRNEEKMEKEQHFGIKERRLKVQNH